MRRAVTIIFGIALSVYVVGGFFTFLAADLLL